MSSNVDESDRRILLGSDYLYEQIIKHTSCPKPNYEEIGWSYYNYPCDYKSDWRHGHQCRHKGTLFNCLTVSRQWFSIAAKHLWNRYASFDQIIYDLIEPLSTQPDQVSQHYH